MKHLRSGTVYGVCLILALGALACHHDDLLMPPTTRSPLSQRRVAGFVAITFRDIGKPTMRSDALVARSMEELNSLSAERALRGGTDANASFNLTVPTKSGGAPGDATIQLELESDDAFTANGERYFQATYRVRNAQLTDTVAFDTPRNNLTFLPVASFRTLIDGPVLVWNKLDGTQANQLVLPQLKPTGLATTDDAGRVIGAGTDVLQVFTEQEVAAVAVTPDVTNIFPYGFMVKRANSTTTRELPSSPGPTQFDGVVTFAYRVPLQTPDANDPTTITLLMLALDDSQTRITQSLEEQDSAATARVQQRAIDLGATVVRTLPGRPGTFTPNDSLICAVRTLGPASSPTANLTNVAAFEALNPSPFTAGGSRISRNGSIQARFSEPVANAAPENFIVRGLQSGQIRSGRFLTVGNVISSPRPSFVAGEEVEVVLTEGLACPGPWVGRLRIGATGGSGQLTLATALQEDPEATAVAVGDFNGDTLLDLAIPSATLNHVTIQFGNGAGGFTNGNKFPTGRGPDWIVAGDFNGDGILDLATSNKGDNDVTVLLGNSSGGFSAPISSPCGGSPKHMAVGDVNGDGILDLVTVNFTNTITALLGNGDGTFRIAQTLPDANRPEWVAIGDLNRDGSLDFVVADSTTGAITTFIGRGNGTFTPGASFATLENGTSAVALGDLDGDGILDAVTANNTSGGNFSVFRGNGDGTFGTAVKVTTGGGRPQTVALADVNGDGRLDLVTSVYNPGPGTGAISVKLNDGTLAFPNFIDFDSGAAIVSCIIVSDFNRDGIIDLVASDTRPSTAARIGVYLGRPGP